MAELADAHGSGPCGSDTMRFKSLFLHHMAVTERLPPLSFLKNIIQNRERGENRGNYN